MKRLLTVFLSAQLLAFLCYVAPAASGAESLRITIAPHAKKEAQEIAKIRRIPLRWQVIADHPDYPSDDVIVAALTVNDPQLKPSLPAKPAEQDCTATVQDAIDQVWANGGGTVFLPAGEYLFSGSLNVRSRVTLRGQWNLPMPSDWKPGTVLKIMTTGTTGNVSPFLTLQSDAAIQGLTFWYPTQKPDAPAPCPPTVLGKGGNTIYDVSFVNSWEALSIPSAAMLVLRGAYGTAIHTGLTAGHGVAFPRFDSVRFSPDFWTWWPLSGARVTADRNRVGSYANHMWQSGSGVRLHEMDGCNFFHGDIAGYAEGFVMEDNESAAESEDGSPHGHGIRVKVHDCRTALRSRIGGMNWLQCEFNGMEYGLRSTEGGSISLTESRVAGGKCAVLAEASSRLRMHGSQTSFDGPLQLLGRNSADLTQCRFTSPTPQINAGTQASGQLLGNTAGGKPIAVSGSGRFTLDSTAPGLQPVPPFGLDYSKDWNRTRKPAKAVLFNVRDVRFAGGAKGNGAVDDSAAVQAAISAARANGGGIVFFPSGYYRLRGTFDLGAGVEVRGAAGARYAAGSGAVEGDDQLMSVLVVEPNSGGHEGAPLFNLGDGSGVRGLNFFYPNQNWQKLLDGNAPFADMPFTITAKGQGNYVINCSAPNPDQFAHFIGAHDFLVEGCLLGGSGTVFRVSGGAKTGRIQNCHVKPSGFWGGLTDIPNTGENRTRYGEKVATRLVVFDLQDCSDITLAGVFGRTAHRLISASGAAGRAILIGGEQLQNGFIFEREGHEPFDLIASDTNLGMHGDGTGKHAIFLDKGFHGTVHAFEGADGGTADYVAKVLGGELITQQRATPGFGYRSPRGVFVGKGGSLTVLAGDFGNDWTQTIEPGGKLLANTGQPPMISAPGQLQFDEYGIKLDRNGTARSRDERSWSQRLVAGDSFRFTVTNPELLNNKNGKLEVSIGLYTDAACQVSLYYASATGEKLARTVKSKDADFSFLHFTLRDAHFTAASGYHLRLAINGNVTAIRPRLAYVAIARK